MRYRDLELWAGEWFPRVRFHFSRTGCRSRRVWYYWPSGPGGQCSGHRPDAGRGDRGPTYADRGPAADRRRAAAGRGVTGRRGSLRGSRSDPDQDGRPVDRTGPNGPAIQQAGTGAVAALQAQDTTNASQLAGVAAQQQASSPTSQARRGVQAVGNHIFKQEPTTTTTTSPTPPLPKCNPSEEISKLTKELAEVNNEIEEQKKKLKEIEKLPITDTRRLDFDRESARINAKLAGLINSALECGYKIAYDPDRGFEIVPNSRGR
jgi:hypothetical protein